MRVSLVVLALCVTGLAGCADSGPADVGAVNTRDPGLLKEGKGAIAGLVVDDAFRPIPDALVLVQDTGATTETNANGEFFFIDLDPGQYVLKVSAAGHEAAPMTVTVQEGVYNDAQLEARRVSSENGRTITQEYSVFISCSGSAPVITITTDCTGDRSGESYRPGFDADYTSVGNITWMVTEMKASKAASPENGAFKVVVRERGNGQYYASAFTVDGDYLKLVNPFNGTSEQDTENRNSAWINDRPIEVLLFPQGAFKQETQGGMDSVCGQTGQLCGESRGLGAQIGVRAQFIQTVFIGDPPPNVDPLTYCILC